MIADVLAVAVAALCLLVVVSPRINTGIVPTAGLTVIGAAALWAVDDFSMPSDVLEMLLAGLGLLGFGVVWRVWVRA